MSMSSTIMTKLFFVFIAATCAFFLVNILLPMNFYRGAYIYNIQVAHVPRLAAIIIGR